MKKTETLLLCLLFFGTGIHAQTFYTRAGLGFAVTTAANISTSSYYNSGGNASTISGKKEGIGTGVPFVLAAGYKLNPNLGFEFGIDYFTGFSMSSKSGSDTYSSTSKTRGQMLSLVPAVFFTFPINKLSPYARLGLKIGIVNNVTYEYNNTYNSSQLADIESKSKNYGGVAMGVQAAVGTDYAFNDMVSIFGEIQVDGISFSPTHGKYTVYNVDGVDQLSSMDLHEKSWNYLKEIDNSKNHPSDEPDERFRTNYRFGNVGLIIGAKINIFNGKSSTTGANAKNSNETQPSKEKSKYERHYVDLGVGFGLDYGGLVGAKVAWLPIPYVSVFAAGGYYLFGFGWNAGATWHILPSTSRYSLRPNIKLMYGVNGGTMVTGADKYNKMFYGVTPGAGLEIMFGKSKRNGLDFDLNIPIHGQDFRDQLDAMKADPAISGVKDPWPVALSLGFHHEF